jgi:hypothetical protein
MRYKGKACEIAGEKEVFGQHRLMKHELIDNRGAPDANFKVRVLLMKFPA